MLVLAALLSNTAHAGTSIGAEYLFSIPLSDNDSANLGEGIGGRFGFSFDLLAVTFTPEIGVTYWNGGNQFIPEAGLRLQFAKVVEPGLFAHINRPLVEGGEAGWDAGFTLDFTAIPKLDIGGQAGVININGRFTAQTGIQLHLNL
ncbi:MAG: hypothetical protein AAGA48_28565 [Myxococcota bacterium]